MQKLSAAGYTTFVITHRAAPRFHFPDAVEDAQRAVRYVLLTAKEVEALVRIDVKTIYN